MIVNVTPSVLDTLARRQMSARCFVLGPMLADGCFRQDFPPERVPLHSCREMHAMTPSQKNNTAQDTPFVERITG
jgi:hypothetical protein